MAIFGATASKKSKVFQAGAATATIGSVPAMLLGVTVQVQRSMSPIPTLTDGVVWSAQPVQGTLQAQSILTTENSGDFIKNIAEGDACKPIPCNVQMKDAACDSKNINLSIEDGYCSAVSFAIQGSQGYIGNDFTIQFTVCKIS